jgi:tRNA(His) 5'-end guanylyltransferase
VQKQCSYLKNLYHLFHTLLNQTYEAYVFNFRILYLDSRLIPHYFNWRQVAQTHRNLTKIHTIFTRFHKIFRDKLTKVAAQQRILYIGNQI